MASSSPDADERSALLNEHNTAPDSNSKSRRNVKIVYGLLTLLFVAGLVVFLTVWNGSSLPEDPHKAALAILSRAPVIVSFILYNPLSLSENGCLL